MIAVGNEQWGDFYFVRGTILMYGDMPISD